MTRLYWTGTKIFSIIIEKERQRAKQNLANKHLYVMGDTTCHVLHRQLKANTTGNTLQPRWELVYKSENHGSDSKKRLPPGSSQSKHSTPTEPSCKLVLEPRTDPALHLLIAWP